jgi:hypothetical protein
MAGPDCQDCLMKIDDGCTDPINKCELDPSCNQNYRPCLFDGAPCCKANGGVWAGQLAQTAHECIVAKCAIECNVNPHCGDCLLSSLETDVDCGGDACKPCKTGKKCAWDGDCESATCSANGTCL